MTQAPTTGSEDTVILEEMFVQIARNVTSDESTLTLQDVSPSTLYFSDRPERVVGHMTTEQFVDQWSEGPNSFLEDPPNAVLSYVGMGMTSPPMRLWCCEIRWCRAVRSATPSRYSTAPCRPRRGRSRCSSIRSVVR